MASVTIDTAAPSPWMCHVCGATSRGDAPTCDICFRTACPAHLRRTTVFNKESGLYEFVSVCLHCAAAEVLT